MSNEHKAHHPAHHGPTEPKAEPLMGGNSVVWFAVLVVVVGLVAGFIGYALGGMGTGAGSAFVDKAELKNSVQGYISKNLLPDASLDLVVSDANATGNGLYELNYSILQNGSVVDAGKVYALGNKLILGAVFEMDKALPVQQVATAAPEKIERPKADLFIFSYCPAGTAALEGFAQAADVLKSSADVSVKFFSHMHGQHELQQNKIQECIQQVDKPKYWSYAQRFVSEIYPVCGQSRSVECDKNMSVSLMDSLGINSSAVMACVASSGDSLYENDKSEAAALSLQYSPSVVVNGLYLPNADRSAEGLKTIVCNAYTAAPSECSLSLNASAASANASCGS